MYEIQVADRQTLLQLDPAWVESVVQSTLAAEGVAWAAIDVALLDDASIHAVNRDHLGHDYPTDVISFLYDSESQEQPIRQAELLRGTGKSLEGELVVSTETALRMAREFDWPAQAEFTLYLVHGLLHLCGYDDLSPEELVIMRSRERSILQIWNLTPHYKLEID